MKRIISIICAVMFCVSAHALQIKNPDGSISTVTGIQDKAGNIIGSGSPLPVASTATTATGTTSAVTLGTTSAQIIAAGAVTVYYSICNDSTSATVACAIGASAVVNGAGSYTLGAGQCLSNSPLLLDNGAINCIASATSTPLTMQVK